MTRYGGTNAQRHRMRCSKSKCRKRFTLPRHPNSYTRAVKCPACGTTSVASVEAQRRREQQRQSTCFCNAYPFPHKAGSLRMCSYHPMEHIAPTLDEMREYEQCLHTPRSG